MGTEIGAISRVSPFDAMGFRAIGACRAGPDRSRSALCRRSDRPPPFSLSHEIVARF